MTSRPQPNDLASGYTAHYDVWNWLMTVIDGGTSNVIAEYE
jgi:hypothetical protein